MLCCNKSSKSVQFLVKYKTASDTEKFVVSCRLILISNELFDLGKVNRFGQIILKAEIIMAYQ